MLLNIPGHSRHTKAIMQWTLLVLVLVLLIAANPSFSTMQAVRVLGGHQAAPGFQANSMAHSVAPRKTLYVDQLVLEMPPENRLKNRSATSRITSRIKRPTASLVIVGDIMLGRQVNIEMMDRDDFTWPFHQTVDALKDADLTLGNLEAPLVTNCPFASTGILFCAAPCAVEGLVWADIDGVSLANNHAHTYGDSGFEETVELLQEAGIKPITDNMMMLSDIDGLQIGVIGFDDSDTVLDLEQAIEATREASTQVDILIGMLHWGIEYQPEPNARQHEVGHALVDAGMDVIIGAHPHLIQPVEDYNGKPIFYSLGNFIFDQMWWQETRMGALVRLKLVKKPDGVIVDYEMAKVEIHDYGQPVVVE
ncbi:MAG: CapA family protein [Anaerolineae bacterium]|nr:CapA family protein [Anaerolineae bacterium]